ncbi:hypothetical protein [Vibrio sp. TRT 29B02]|uniref:hypothetical protein n=1 Tax=Vibrio sp. TRT 29B02 TaxID=3418508 RepID=UPI003CF302E9
MTGFIKKVMSKSNWILASIAVCMVLSYGFGNELKYILALAVTDIQQLHVDLYWLTVEEWLSTSSNWTILSYVFFTALGVYTLAKAYTIVRHYDVNDDNYLKRLSSLMVGCGLAAFAPYRSTQAFERTKDYETSEEVAKIRVKTLSLLKIDSELAHRAGVAMTKDKAGINSLTDSSSTYIMSVMKKNNLSPNESEQGES